jgi:hypothetical protein
MIQASGSATDESAPIVELPKPPCVNVINAMMVAYARSGLSSQGARAGDPTIFGRAGEDIAALRGANISFEIVPGETAELLPAHDLHPTTFAYIVDAHCRRQSLQDLARDQPRLRPVQISQPMRRTSPPENEPSQLHETPRRHLA